MAEASSTGPEVTVEAGSERVRVTGQSALIIAQVMLHEAEINQIPVGRVVATFGHGKTTFEVTHSHVVLRTEVNLSRTFRAACRKDV